MGVHHPNLTGHTEAWECITPTEGAVRLHNPCRLGSPTLQIGRRKSEVARKCANWLQNPHCKGGAPKLQSGGEIRKEVLPVHKAVAHKWAYWLHNLCCPKGPRRFRVGGQNQQWPTMWADWPRRNNCYVHTFTAENNYTALPPPPTHKNNCTVLILSPTLKLWGNHTPRGLCSQSAHLWATADFVPALKHWGQSQMAGAM